MHYSNVNSTLISFVFLQITFWTEKKHQIIMCFSYCSNKGFYKYIIVKKIQNFLSNDLVKHWNCHTRNGSTFSPLPVAPFHPFPSPLQKERREVKQTSVSYSGSQEGQAMPNSTGRSAILHHFSNCGLRVGTEKHKPITPSVSELISKQDYKCYSHVTDFGAWKLTQSEVFDFILY